MPHGDTTGDETMMPATESGATLPGLDNATRVIVRLAGGIASLDEASLRPLLADAAAHAPSEWVEEVILQSYLFAGFPRALNAMREWRRTSGIAAPRADAGERFEDVATWQRAGQATCATVYGAFYERLRQNIRALHPALDAWMIVEGYGKVMSRGGLDLRRRELCVAAACATARQDRQLHSHLHGALHAGATADDISAMLEAIDDLLLPAERPRVRGLWNRVRPIEGASRAGASHVR